MGGGLDVIEARLDAYVTFMNAAQTPGFALAGSRVSFTNAANVKSWPTAISVIGL